MARDGNREILGAFAAQDFMQEIPSLAVQQGLLLLGKDGRRGD